MAASTRVTNQILDEQYGYEWYFHHHVTKGLSYKEMADLLGVPYSYVYTRIKKLNVPNRKAHQELVIVPTPSAKKHSSTNLHSNQDFLNKYGEPWFRHQYSVLGKSYSQIAQQIGTSRERVLHLCELIGIPRNEQDEPRQIKEPLDRIEFKYEHFFSAVDSQDVAYWLGFLKNTFRNVDDMGNMKILIRRNQDRVIQFLSLLGVKNFDDVVSKIRSGYYTTYIPFCSTTMMNDLKRQQGFTDSLSFFPSMEGPYYPSFLRGYFESRGVYNSILQGDNYTYIHLQGREQDIQSVISFLEDQGVGGKGRKPAQSKKSEKRYFTRWGNSNQMIALLSFLYTGSLIHDPKKFEFYQKFARQLNDVRN